MKNSIFRRNNELTSRIRFHFCKEERSGADDIRVLKNSFVTFRMRDDDSFGILRFKFKQFTRGKKNVDLTGTRPKNHFTIQLLRQVAAQVAVRTEQNLPV